MRCVMSIFQFLLPVINRTYSRLSASVSVLFVFSHAKAALLFWLLIRLQFTSDQIDEKCNHKAVDGRYLL